MPDLMLDTWSEAVDDFPLLATPPDKLRALVHYAILAPSSHNTQPWRFRVRGNALELRADRARALPVVDPADRELMISLGAALFHLRVAARRFGHLSEVEPFPEPRDPDLVARLRLGAELPPNDEERRLFSAIPRRHTARVPFDYRAVPAALAETLRVAATAEGCWLARVDGARKLELAGLVAEGDRLQMADPTFRRELSAWVHPNRSDRRDGIPGYAHGVGDLASVFGPLVIRTFDLGSGQAARDQELALHSPLLVVLGSPGDEPQDWLLAGQALARLLLLARDAELHASFLNQPIEVPVLRDRLRAVVGHPGMPQMLIRLGFAQEVRPTPRRPVAEVLEA
jgi:nitroreductase